MNTGMRIYWWGCSLCFAGWYAAEQKWKREQRQKLQHAKKHAVTGHMLDELGLQTNDHGLFTILCPTCRYHPLHSYAPTCHVQFLIVPMWDLRSPVEA